MEFKWDIVGRGRQGERGEGVLHQMHLELPLYHNTIQLSFVTTILTTSINSQTTSLGGLEWSSSYMSGSIQCSYSEWWLQVITCCVCYPSTSAEPVATDQCGSSLTKLLSNGLLSYTHSLTHTDTHTHTHNLSLTQICLGMREHTSFVPANRQLSHELRWFLLHWT